MQKPRLVTVRRKVDRHPLEKIQGHFQFAQGHGGHDQWLQVAVAHQVAPQLEAEAGVGGLEVVHRIPAGIDDSEK
jgi:hypothetical protein